MELVNLSPSLAEKKLFFEYGMYLTDKSEEEGNRYRKYTTIKNLRDIKHNYIDKDVWPESIRPHRKNIQDEDYLYVDLTNKRAELHCKAGGRLLPLVNELLNM